MEGRWRAGFLPTAGETPVSANTVNVNVERSKLEEMSIGNFEMDASTATPVI